jgi:hypothetical protein
MNFIAICLAAVVVLPALGLVLWVGHSMAAVTDELRSFVGYDGIHFDE